MSNEVEVLEAVPIDSLEVSDTYKSSVTDLCDALYQSQSSVVATYWSIGELLHNFVNDRLDEDETLSVAKCLKALSEDVYSVSGGVLSYSNSTLRNMLNFRETISKSQLTKLVDIGCPIYKALPMCISDMTDEDRDTVIDELESGAIDTANIKERIEELQPKDTREETRGAPAAMGPMKTAEKISNTLNKMASLIEGDLVVHCATVFDSDDKQAQEDFYAKLVLIDNWVSTLSTTWKPLHEGYIK